MVERHPDWVERHFSPDDLEAIRAAVAAAERQTAGEIRVHLERRAVGDVLAHARRVFHALGMHRTRHRANVLLYLAVDDRKFAIVNGRIVGPGDEVNGARIVDITPTTVLLRDAQGRLRSLSLGGVGRNPSAP